MTVTEADVKFGRLTQPEDLEMRVGCYIEGGLNLGQLFEVSDEVKRIIGSVFLDRTGVTEENLPYISNDYIQVIVHQILEDSVKVS